MLRIRHQSLLVQLLSGYLLFVLIVLGTGFIVNTVVEQELQSQVQASDLALAQEMAIETSIKIGNAKASVVDLSQQPEVRQGDLAAMQRTFSAFKVARSDVDRIYWLDARGVLRVSVPADPLTLGVDFSHDPLSVYQEATQASGPIVNEGVVDLTTFDAVVAIAQAVRAPDGTLEGIVATNLSLNVLSVSLRTVIDAQERQQRHLLISLLDQKGQLIGTSERERLLQPVANELPGASDALAGHSATTLGTGPDGQEWLFSATPVPGTGWAVVVQQPADEALAVVYHFRTWLAIAAVLFALGGCCFWLILARRVIQPLQTLATHYRAFPPPRVPTLPTLSALARRVDAVGELARSLQRLEHDVSTQLAELRTLLETSNAVVASLDPQAVVETIIDQVQRLVDVQAVTVYVEDEHEGLRVLASVGRSEAFRRLFRYSPDDQDSPSMLALRSGHPVQILAEEGKFFPSISYAEGFRSLLSIPIISRHVGSGVLVVHRKQPQTFSTHEVDLLLTFANYAMLAWEHAVLYERTDERLRETAKENKRLYLRATKEKQTLAAIMSSMSDGLILASVNGRLLYANPGAQAIIGPLIDLRESCPMASIHAVLRGASARPDEYNAMLARIAQGDTPTWMIEIGEGTAKGAGARATNGSENAGARHPQAPAAKGAQKRSIRLQVFDVHDEAGLVNGRGLLLRDVTSEREIDQLKTTLLATVGHELRTPLSIIKGNASTLLQDDVSWSAEDQRHMLQIISAQTDRLAQLVSDLLDLSRLEAGILTLHQRPRQLGELLEQILRQLDDAIPPPSVTLPEQLPLLDVDGPRIEVVLRNLLANARAYGAGEVRIAARHEDGRVVVSFWNDGPGIDPDELPHIFERFYRAKQGIQQRSGGTGLGLAICKAVIEAHGGSIWAESGEQGTTIAFSLPVVAVPAREEDFQGEQVISGLSTGA
ncbi:MAG TPA: ATP-binding protein [Ktedonobacterales bacterium]|nr:ATP-binding protein [Ktedonobacterales bacterium]